MIIRHLAFTGSDVESAGLDFQSGPNLVYGASNTGKSFALESLDFMLGGSKQLPDIKERKGYETIWLGFSLEGVGDFTLSRGINGGSYELYEGLVKSAQSGQNVRILHQTHNAKNENNLSQFLLKYLELDGKLVAKNSAGVKVNMSFRDLAKIILVDETSIQIKRSPIESGHNSTRPKERRIFSLLLTGTDDNAIVPINEDNFKVSKKVRLEMMEEMISDVEIKLANNYSDVGDLLVQNKQLDQKFKQIQEDLRLSQEPISDIIDKKRSLSIDIPIISNRLQEVQGTIERFAQLKEVYLSDIERLKALEEAGFILSIGSDLDCSLCGAPAEAQKHSHSLKNIEQMRYASVVEVQKIERQLSELKETVLDIKHERDNLKNKLFDLKDNLKQIEHELVSLSPAVNENSRKLSEMITEMDNVRQGLVLLEQKKELILKRDELNTLKKPPSASNPKLNIPTNEVYEFCKVVSKVLKKWEFPGECDVSFDYKNYDLIIDGKRRVDNGKGVRAVTHAAFKVAMLLFCRGRGLSHPGFIVFDTPLLTYRDPMKNPKLGELTDDEKELAKSSVKQRFFEHLASIHNLGQFIILENIDPPKDVDELAHVDLFYGNAGGGRNGLFPVFD